MYVQKSLKNKHNGFTIVELLIVIMVIAILASISIVAYTGIQKRARDAERVQDIGSMQKVLEVYYIDYNKFPTRDELRDPSWRAANLASQDQGIFINPLDKGSDNSITASGSIVPINKYSYYEINDSKSYVIDYKLEKSPENNINIRVNK